jgi:hypothetical protein
VLRETHLLLIVTCESTCAMRGSRKRDEDYSFDDDGSESDEQPAPKVGYTTAAAQAASICPTITAFTFSLMLECVCTRPDQRLNLQQRQRISLFGSQQLHQHAAALQGVILLLCFCCAPFHPPLACACSLHVHESRQQQSLGGPQSVLQDWST